jgi:hypothetical protein
VYEINNSTEFLKLKVIILASLHAVSALFLPDKMCTVTTVYYVLYKLYLCFLVVSLVSCPS